MNLKLKETTNSKESGIGKDLLREIQAALLCLSNILNHPEEMMEYEKPAVVELTYHLGRVVSRISDEAFIHAFQGSLAVQRFIKEPNNEDQIMAQRHLLAIKSLLFSVCDHEGEESPLRHETGRITESKSLAKNQDTRGVQ